MTTFNLAKDDDGGFRQSRKNASRSGRLARALRSRFASPQAVLAHLGLDAAEVGLFRETVPTSKSHSDANGMARINAEKMRSMDKSRSLTRDMEEEKPMQFDAEEFREALRKEGLADDDIETVMGMLPEHFAGDMSDEGEREFAEHGHAHGQQASRQRNLESSEREYASPHRREDAEARRREDRDSTQRETRDSMPRPGTKGGMGGRFSGAHDSDMEFIHQVLARQPEVYTGGGGNRSWRAEERAMAEVARIRKLAGVGSGMGLDAAQSRSRSERILDVTFREQERRRRSEDELAKLFPEAKRIGIAY
ncbi:MAG: hypothetical protein ACLQFW_15970 [Xanthobacteraceae bacterium]